MKNYASSLRKAEEILLGFERKVKAKSGGGGGIRLKANTGIKNLVSAGQGKPEVTVKIPTRKSKTSNNTKGVMNHLSYISRNGKLELEDKDGKKYMGLNTRNDITQKWKNLGLINDVDGKKQTMNIVLSMPTGTSPEAVKNASREFARQLFSHNHEFVMALHTDTDKPHVHLTVSMVGYDGRRLNPKKQDLFNWRLLFAEKMREQGVDCTATKRVHRGQFQKQSNHLLERMADRGADSFVNQRKLNELKEAIRTNKRPLHPFLNEQLHTQQLILKEYKVLSKQLYQEGYKTEAKAISQLAKKLEQSKPITQNQEVFDKAKQGHYPKGYKLNSIFEQLKDSNVKEVIDTHKETLSEQECKQLAKRCYINGLKTEAKQFSDLATEKAQRLESDKGMSL